jgi:hypothetical protein
MEAIIKTGRNNGHTPKYAGQAVWVSYCPYCPIRDLSHPQDAPKVRGVRKGIVKGSCGHTWVVGKGEGNASDE